MRLQVLKALANPSHIFYVPYSLAVLNFAILFILYMIAFVVSLIISKGMDPVSPMFFIIGVIVIHSILAVYSKKDPQLGQIIVAKVNLMKRKIPGKLAA